MASAAKSGGSKQPLNGPGLIGQDNIYINIIVIFMRIHMGIPRVGGLASVHPVGAYQNGTPIPVAKPQENPG